MIISKEICNVYLSLISNPYLSDALALQKRIERVERAVVGI